MFYTDELRRLTPLAYLAVLCLVFWAVIFFAWPFWTGVIVAVAFGILGSFLFGAWFRERIRSRIAVHKARTAKKIQDQLDGKL